MADNYNIEIKVLNVPTYSPFTGAVGGTHHADNVTGEATGSWADAIVADAVSGAGKSLYVIVYNFGASPLYVANSDTASPTQYSVVAPDTQRELRFNPSSDLKVKTG